MRQITRLPILEALRGLAAFYVFFHHFAHFYLVKAYPCVDRLFILGQVAVLGFFIMSGFVIHYSCFAVDPELTFKAYFIRRFRRIYPIFLISIGTAYLCTCLVAGRIAPPFWLNLSGNLFLMQDSHYGRWSAPAYMNAPTWSLSFEWFFYMAYFPIARFLRNKQGLQKFTVAGFAAAGLAVHAWYPNPLSLFAVFFPIWWSGVELAREYVTRGKISWKGQSSQILLLAATVLAWYAVFMDVPFGKAANTPLSIDQFPNLEFRQLLTGLCLLLAVMALSGEKTMRLMRRLTHFRKLGSVSYGVFVMHYPLLTLLPLFAPQGYVVLPFLLGILPMVIGIAYLLECRLQPWVNGFMRPDRGSRSALAGLSTAA